MTSSGEPERSALLQELALGNHALSAFRFAGAPTYGELLKVIEAAIEAVNEDAEAFRRLSRELNRSRDAQRPVPQTVRHEVLVARELMTETINHLDAEFRRCTPLPTAPRPAGAADPRIVERTYRAWRASLNRTHELYRGCREAFRLGRSGARDALWPKYDQQAILYATLIRANIFRLEMMRMIVVEARRVDGVDAPRLDALAAERLQNEDAMLSLFPRPRVGPVEVLKMRGPSYEALEAAEELFLPGNEWKRPLDLSDELD